MIKTKRLIIKNFNLNLVNVHYLKWVKDKNIKENITFTCKNISKLKKDVKKRLSKKNSFFLSIHSKSDRHIGNIYFHDINIKKKSAYMGIMIGDKKWRGKGVGSEVINVIIKKILIIRKIYYLFLGVNNNNKVAIKLYKKIGFKNKNIKTRNRLMMLDIKDKLKI